MEQKKAVSAPFHKGVNFTNWLEYRSADQIDENFFTRKDFENAGKLGCDVVRLPIHFEKMCEEANGYRIPEKIFGILDRVAAWAEDLKMYVIFDFHNSTHVDSATSDTVEDILRPIWSQMAEHFKETSEYVVYELMNEPHNIEISLWNQIIERIFQMVRSIDTKHYIIVGGADWNSFAAMKTLPDFRDEKVIYTFHFYDPHTFTHQGAGWCHMERVVGIPFPYDPEKMPALPENPTEREKQCFREYPQNGILEEVIAFFDQYVEFSRERNAPVYCGEFGCFAPFMSNEQRVTWYQIIVDLLEEKGIARTSWDYYGTFGIFSFDRMRTPNGWRKPEFPEDLNVELLNALRLCSKFD